MNKKYFIYHFFIFILFFLNLSFAYELHYGDVFRIRNDSVPVWDEGWMMNGRYVVPRAWYNDLLGVQVTANEGFEWYLEKDSDPNDKGAVKFGDFVRIRHVNGSSFIRANEQFWVMKLDGRRDDRSKFVIYNFELPDYKGFVDFNDSIKMFAYFEGKNFGMKMENVFYGHWARKINQLLHAAPSDNTDAGIFKFVFEPSPKVTERLKLEAFPLEERFNQAKDKKGMEQIKAYKEVVEFAIKNKKTYKKSIFLSEKSLQNDFIEKHLKPMVEARKILSKTSDEIKACVDLLELILTYKPLYGSNENKIKKFIKTLTVVSKPAEDKPIVDKKEKVLETFFKDADLKKTDFEKIAIYGVIPEWVSNNNLVLDKSEIKKYVDRISSLFNNIKNLKEDSENLLVFNSLRTLLENLKSSGFLSGVKIDFDTMIKVLDDKIAKIPANSDGSEDLF